MSYPSADSIAEARKFLASRKTRRGKLSSKDAMCGLNLSEWEYRSYKRSRLTAESAQSISEFLEISPAMTNRMHGDENFRKRVQELSSIFNKVL